MTSMIRIGLIGFLTVAVGVSALPASAAETKNTAPTKSDLVQPEALAKDLALPESKRPVILQVGFSVLYKSGHIPGSKYVGSGSTARGRAELKKALQALPKSRAVVLYCGCCPWDHCPNVNPAFRVARSLGYTNVKILYIVQDLQRDWVDKGYPKLES
jgi:rhodanese-related sulfurtransferase